MMCKARAVGSGMETPRPTASSPKWSGNPQRRPRAMSGGHPTKPRSSRFRRPKAAASSWSKEAAAADSSLAGDSPATLHPSEMASPPPNSFSNPLQSWVYKESVASVVLVTFTPKNLKAVANYVEKITPTPSNEPQELARARREKLMEDIKIPRCSTGFVIEGAPEDEVYLLTCAHTLDYLFNATTPIPLATMNEMFKIEILCDHVECNYRQNKAPRKYVQAAAVQVDSSKDLVLLRVALSEFQKKCKESHRPLKIARKFPDPLERIVMISWPPFMPRTACAGEISHPGRGYSTVMDHAPDAHSLKLSEVNILGDRGSSGAPLLDGVAEVAGVFHCGSLGTLSFSYFVSFNDLRNKLIYWGLIRGEQVQNDER